MFQSNVVYTTKKTLFSESYRVMWDRDVDIYNNLYTVHCVKWDFKENIYLEVCEIGQSEDLVKTSGFAASARCNNRFATVTLHI